MHRHPTRLAAITLAATAALTLSACGNDDGDSDKAGSEEPPSASQGGTGGAGRPEITFPADAKNVFEYEKTGDAAKDAAVLDSTLAVNSVDEAIFEGSTSTKALGFYNAGNALSAYVRYVQKYIDDEETWVGETRYFNYAVNVTGTSKANVSYCSDESRSYIKDKTGKVRKTQASGDSYVLYNTSLVRNAEGVWQTTDVVSNRGNRNCQP
ncbi:hypothetical protein [Streptomyces sp. NPDC003832]